MKQKQTKSATLAIRITPEEKQIIVLAAKKDRRSVTQFTTIKLLEAAQS